VKNSLYKNMDYNRAICYCRLKFKVWSLRYQWHISIFSYRIRQFRRSFFMDGRNILGMKLLISLYSTERIIYTSSCCTPSVNGHSCALQRCMSHISYCTILSCCNCHGKMRLCRCFRINISCLRLYVSFPQDLRCHPYPLSQMPKNRHDE
jgi:hypothetical protein